jgi:putative phage-type endonuclease
MIEIRGLQQGGNDWLRWRDGGIGGSEASVIYRGELYGKTPYGLWMKKMGLVESVNFTQVQQAHLDRGHALEPEARKLFIERTGIMVEPLCVQSSEHHFMYASLDGINAARDVIVEIKAPAEAMMLKTLESGIPDYYYDQVQHQIKVVNAREGYYFAFNPEVPPYIYIERILPDPAHIQELIRKEDVFWKHVESGVPPWTDLGLEKAQIGMIGLTMFGGYAKVGKDTIGALHQHLFKSTRYSFADPLKKMYCEMHGITLEQLEKQKEKHRPGLVKLGHGMRKIHSDVWVDGVFNSTTGVYGTMSKSGAVITDARYVNEVSAGRKHAARLGVPCRAIWVERPGVKPANDTEKETAFPSVYDIVLVNDLNAKNPEDYAAMERALLKAMMYVPNGKQITISASSLVEKKATARKRINDTKPKKAVRKTSKPSRRQRNRKVS